MAGVGVAYGKIAIWGNVTEYEFGYRAEYCKIISIDSVTPDIFPDGPFAPISRDFINLFRYGLGELLFKTTTRRLRRIYGV